MSDMLIRNIQRALGVGGLIWAIFLLPRTSFSWWIEANVLYGVLAFISAGLLVRGHYLNGRAVATAGADCSSTQRLSFKLLGKLHCPSSRRIPSFPSGTCPAGLRHSGRSLRRQMLNPLNRRQQQIRKAAFRHFRCCSECSLQVNRILERSSRTLGRSLCTDTQK